MQHRCLIYILAFFTNKIHIFTFPAIQLEWNTLFRRLTTNQVCDVIRNMNKLFSTFLSLDCCVLSWSPYRMYSVQRFSITIEWVVCVFFLIIAAAFSPSRLKHKFCVFNHSIQLLDFTNTIYPWRESTNPEILLEIIKVSRAQRCRKWENIQRISHPLKFGDYRYHTAAWSGMQFLINVKHITVGNLPMHRFVDFAFVFLCVMFAFSTRFNGFKWFHP